MTNTTETKYYYVTAQQRSSHPDDDDVESRLILVKLTTDKSDPVSGLMKAVEQVYPPTVGKLVGMLDYDECEAPIEISDVRYPTLR